MTGSFKTRDSLVGNSSGSLPKKKKEISLVSCLRRAVVLLNSNSDDGFFTYCICQKIRHVCGQIMDVYGGRPPLVRVNNQPPAELIRAVIALISSDGQINADARTKLIEELNAALVMISNG